ncbi:hypothetical protein ACTQ5K_18595 [Niallia sp. Sow4_A1]|jgi:hypothetical protein|uniref:hypothetical protein n=1 Tax=Niallia sp. Sow4_A1 TaxID=3438793 RepID=UPI003F96EB83
MNKKILYLIISLLILCTFSLVFLKISNSKANQSEEEDFNFSSVKGILIYSFWDSYIFANKNEEVKIQIPVYDFDSELKSSNIKLENFHIGEVKDLELTPKNKFKDFDQYILDITLIPEKEGQHNLDDLRLTITTEENEYNQTLGKWNFEIQEEQLNNSFLEIKGGTLLENWTDNYNNNFEYSTNLHNISDSSILIKDIEINNPRINIVTGISQDVLYKMKENRFTINLNINQTKGNAVIRPKLVYSIDNKEMFMPLNQAIYASTVPYSELVEILQENGMLNKEK